jgi:hypothetical protein
VCDAAVRAFSPALCEQAVGLYRLAFQAAYREHLADLSAGRRRDMEHLACDVLKTLKQQARGTSWAVQEAAQCAVVTF